ncbi:MAG: phage integrase protein breaking and rejoining enzyme [Nitrospira sp.]|nr:phage integrase protein breaking and rejoining enzyme [Nitrospira sp.]
MYRGIATFAYLSGWRVPSEVLTLRWSQVDFQAGVVRLEPGTTKNDEGRNLPFSVLPELSHLLRSQWDHAVSTELQTGQAVPWVFFWNDRGTMKRIHVKAFYRRWQAACNLAGVPKRIPHDFRRTAVRNFERAGVPRSVAMKLTGHKTEAVYRRYAIVCEAGKIWRRGRDLNSRIGYPISGFQDRHVRPLRHPSILAETFDY